ASATITVKVKAVNDKPVAVNDSAETDEDTVVTIDVTANDTDVDGTIDVASVDLDPATTGIQTSFSVTGQGTYSVDNSGIVTFTPAANYNGTTTPISYTVNDNQGAVSASATITVKVKAVNDKPVAVNDNAETDEDTVVTIDVTANDTDVDGTIDVASVDLDPATTGIQTSFSVTGQGTYSVDNSGIVTFTPAANYNGTTTPISYTVNDNQGAVSASATITVKVKAVNDKPVAVNDNAETDEDTVVTIDVTANDTDVDGTIDVTSVDLDPATAGIQTSFSVTGQGTYSVDNSGIVTFTPAANYNGTTTPISYTVQDNQGAVSASATITVKVKAVNDKPVAVNDSAEIDEDTVVTIDVTANDTDVDGTIDVASVDLDPATAGIQTTFSVTGQGTYSVDNSGIVTFTPAANYNGTTTPINYTVNDNQGAVSASATITVKVKAVNDKPVADNDTYIVAEGETLTITSPGVLVNDTDVEGDTLTAVLVTGPTHGILTFNADGSFSYTHDGTETLADSFTYKVNDGTVDGNTVTVNITVKAVNDAPVVRNDINSIISSTSEATGIKALQANDIDGTIASYTILTLPSHGVLAVGGVPVTVNQVLTPLEAGTLTYDPSGTFTGIDTFTFTATDDLFATALTAGTITIPVGNNAPIVEDIITAGIPSRAGVTAISTLKGTDTDGTIADYTVLSLPSNGILALDGVPVTINQVLTPLEVGRLTYAPSGAFSGNDIFTFIATDNNGAISSLGKVTIKVEKTILDAKNDVIPSVVGIDKTITVVNVLDNDLLNNRPVVISDIKLGVLTSDPKGMLTLKPDGTVELSPNAPAGDYSLTYEICEKANASNCTSAVVLVTVEAPTMTVTTNSYCSDNAPYVSYTVTGDNFVPTGLLTINWIDSANKIVATQTNMPLNGSVLWPGAVVDANKKATDWPGWILVGGQWIEGNDGFELTRPAVKMQFSLNPTKTVVVNYPSAISGCNAMPTFGINASNDDDAALANGLNGSSKVINVLDNDKLNGVPVKPADVIIKGLDLPKGITLNADGTIDVAPSTKGGNYTITYQICEKANQSNCTTATAKVFVEVPEISIIKTVELNDSNNNGYAEAGETLTYSFTITNTGNVDLENIQVSDPLPGILMNGGPINLAAGQSDMSSISGTYTLTQADVNSGSISNQATVSGSTKSGITVSDKSDFSDLKGEKPTVLGLSGCVIKVYNAVSSNGDNKNERFYIQGIECYPENTVQIYNRWGVLVFERDHYNNNDIAFRGVSEGRVTVKDSDGLPEGTYYYIIRYKDKQSNAQQEAGYLYLTK
ncbi:Ig-like domain-containing protein, partial [Flavobacterium plurextorum]